MRRFRSPLLLAAVGLVLHTGTSPVGAQDEVVNPETALWHGTITLSREGNGIEPLPKPEKGKTVSVSGSRTVRDRISLDVCGQAGELHLMSATRELRDYSRLDRREVADETPCGPRKEPRSPNERPLLAGKAARPGDSVTSSSESHVGLLRSDAFPPLCDSTVVMLDFPGPGRFAISGIQIAPGNRSSVSTTTNYDACAEEISVSEVRHRTGDPGLPPDSAPRVSEESAGGRKIVENVDPPREVRFEFSFGDAYAGRILRGEKIISRIDEPHYQETVSAVWDLAAESPCYDVRHALMEDLAFGEAYADSETARVASSMAGFEALVGERAWRVIYGSEPPAGVQMSEVDSSAGGQPPLGGLEELRRQIRKQCRPQPIFDSHAAHQRVHDRQRASFPEFDDGKPATYGMMEAAACGAGARVLFDWLRANCPDSTLEDARRRLGGLEKVGERYGAR